VLPRIPDVSWPGRQGRPSVVAVTSQAPWPLDSGGHLRTYHLMRSLAARLDVRLVAPVSAERMDDSAAALATAGVAPSVILTPKRSFAGESVKALRAAIDQEPYVLFARHRRPPVLDTLRHEIAGRAPSVLYLDHLDSLVYADALPAIPVVIDMHNVYSRLAARMAVESGVIRRRYLERESELLKKMEQRAVDVAHTVLAVSNEEAAYFRSLGARRVVSVPNGVDCDGYDRLPIGNRPGPPTLLFVGALSWPPNAHAAKFLATDVLPVIRMAIPSARLMIVGRDPGPDVLALAQPGSNVEVAANVKEVAPYYEAAHALAVPLESGGGTRLKILEAFAAGVPVVSTPVGCEGIDAVPGSHLVVADRTEFAAATIKLLGRPDRARVLAVRARSLVREKYDWSVVGRAACDAVLEAANAGTTSATAPMRNMPKRTDAAWGQAQ
jgi:polysaccharide biosynthesis protein PslH